MREKEEQTTALTTHGFFSTPTMANPDWEFVSSDFFSTIFFNRKQNTVLGLGHNNFEEYLHHSELVWMIPTRNFPIRQVSAGSHHVLILYADGLLQGFGRGQYGQLGIGCIENRDAVTVNISLPNKEIAQAIATAKDYSLVLTNKGNLYGFGDNADGQLGLGAARTVEFPTLIPMPSEVRPRQIYTAHNRTLIICEKGQIFGFGQNINDVLGFPSPWDDRYKQSTPKRLDHFETLAPQEFFIGKDALILRSINNEYYFYGIDYYWLGTRYNDKRFKVPENSKISFTNEHIVAYSAQGELWCNVAHETKGFKKITLAENLKPQSAIAGYEASFILCDNRYYAFGSNRSNKLGLRNERLVEEPTQISFNNLYYKSKYIQHELSTGQESPENEFLGSYGADFEDNSLLLLTLFNHPSRVIEFNRPRCFGKSKALRMIYAFYANTSTVDSSLFEKKQVGKEPVTQEAFKKYPVIFLDLASLNPKQLSTSYEKLMADLYISHRQVLFNGVLKDSDKKESYQRVATQNNRYSFIEDMLLNLVTYLYKQYKTPIRLLIDNADYMIHDQNSADNMRYLLSFIEPAIQSKYVMQTVLMGVHPSGFAADDPEKHTETLFQLNSPFNPFFSLHPFSLDKSKLIPNNHFIHALRVNKEDCAIMQGLLQGEVLDVILKPNLTGAIDGAFVFEYLIQSGILEIKAKIEPDTYSLAVPHIYAGETLKQLHEKWHTQNLNRITVVLDIDNVLAIVERCNKETALFFLLKGAIFKVCDKTHYVPPGILELIRYLFSNPLIHVVFFSAGKEIRNQPFVKLLLEKALGIDACKTIDINKIVRSYDHLTALNSYSSEKQYKDYGIYSDDYKKDISDAIDPKDLMSRACIVDNDPRIIYYGQEKNYLYTETAGTKCFEKLSEEGCRCNNPEDKLFRVVNAPFRIAGIIQDLLANKDNDPVTERLFDLQFTTNETDPITFKPVWGSTPRGQYYYRSGLNLLRQFNKDLQFVTPQLYKGTIAITPSASEIEILEDSQKHQDGGCTIM